MSLPRTTLVRRNDTHRLIPAKYSKGESVLARIADDDAHLNDIFDLDHATNDRLLAENNLLPGIGVHELVFGVPYYRIVNAAFCHPHPLGSRFNGPDRGAWYAAFEIETVQAEVAFHKWIELAEVSWFDEDVAYDESPTSAPSSPIALPRIAISLRRTWRSGCSMEAPSASSIRASGANAEHVLRASARPCHERA